MIAAYTLKCSALVWLWPVAWSMFHTWALYSEDICVKESVSWSIILSGDSTKDLTANIWLKYGYGESPAVSEKYCVALFNKTCALSNLKAALRALGFAIGNIAIDVIDLLTVLCSFRYHICVVKCAAYRFLCYASYERNEGQDGFPNDKESQVGYHVVIVCSLCSHGMWNVS